MTRKGISNVMGALALVFYTFPSLAYEKQDANPIQQPNPNIAYVKMPQPTQPHAITLTVVGASKLSSQLRDIANTMRAFYERMSRHKINITTRTGTSGGSVGPNSKRLVLNPGANSHVPIIGNSVSAYHELGHEFGMAHADTRIWATQLSTQSYNHEHEPFDPMTVTPAVPSLNVPHLHLLGWFNSTEEAYVEDGGEYVLQVLDRNSDSQSLKALYYPVPGSTREYWFSYVRVSPTHWHVPDGMPGTGIAVHTIGGKAGRGAETYFEGLIGLNAKTQIRTGLILELSEVTAGTVKVKVTKDPNWVLELSPPSQK